MFARLFLLFTIIPVAELYVLIQVGEAIGALNTVAVILVTAALGAYLTRSEGIQAISRIRQAIQAGRPPAEEILHGLFILLGGITLLTPGFITDLIGLSMLVPPLRMMYVGIAGRLLRKRIEYGHWQFISL